MIKIRHAAERGHADHGWLKTYYTFSFADYHDRNHVHFRHLRVLNEDTIQAGQGFGTHGHENMEIITYVFEGALEHKDSTGSGSVLRSGDVQRMSAGRGVTHSEFNHSSSSPLRLLQIWIIPKNRGIDPEYEEKHFGSEEKRDRLRLIVSPKGDEGSLRINQDVKLYASLLTKGHAVEYQLASKRHAWIQVIRGRLTLNNETLAAGDGAAASDESLLRITAQETGELLLFDLS